MALSSLPLFHRIAGSRVVVVGEGEMAQAKRRLIERAGGLVCAETEAHHAQLGFVALDDPQSAKAAANRLRAKGLLVNVADQPDLCDFTLPSILERDPVIIAVGTSGASAGTAKHLRLRLERILPTSLGTLAAKLFSARGHMREKWPDAGDRRKALDHALSEGGALDPLQQHDADAVTEWLEDSGDTQAAQSQPAQQVEITLTSRDPDDLTLRQARWLGMADRVLHEGDVPADILNMARADAVRIVLSGDPAQHDDAPGLTVVVKA